MGAEVLKHCSFLNAILHSTFQTSNTFKKIVIFGCFALQCMACTVNVQGMDKLKGSKRGEKHKLTCIRVWRKNMVRQEPGEEREREIKYKITTY